MSNLNNCVSNNSFQSNNIKGENQMSNPEINNKRLKGSSDAKAVSYNFKGYGNINADTNLTIEYSVAEKLIAWDGGNAYKIADNLICAQKQLDFETNEYLFTIPTTEEVVNKILDTVEDRLESKGQRKNTTQFLNGLVGTVLVADGEVEEHNPDNYSYANIEQDRANLVDAQKVLLANSVCAFHVNKQGFIILKSDRDTKTAWVKDCLDAATKAFGFALPDKTNTKRAFVKDALGVMGVSANGRISMVSNDKGGKFFNRHAMVKHISAVIAEEDKSFDRLFAEISDNRFAAHYGLEQNSLYLNTPLLSLAVGDGGCVVRNDITYTTCKRLDGSLNIDLLFATNPEYKTEVVALAGSNRNNQVKFIKDELKAYLNSELEGKVIAPSEIIEFQNLPIIQNNTNLELTVSKEPIVKKGKAINTETRTIAIELKTLSTVIDSNAKLRGQWFKGMTTRNNDVVVNSKEGRVEANIIFNDNSVKNRKATLIRMWAESEDKLVSFGKDGEFYLVDYCQDTETFTQQKEAIKFSKVQADLDNKYIKSYTVSLITTEKELLLFERANPDAFATVSNKEIIGNGRVRITFKAEGIEAPIVYAVELSSIAENFSVGRKLSAIQSAHLSTFGTPGSFINKTVRNTIKQHSKKISRTIELCASSKVDAHFDLRFKIAPVPMETRDVLAHLLTIANKKHNPREFFRSLAQKFPQGIKISGSTNKGTRHWTVRIPTHLLSIQGSFDSNSGWSFDERVCNVYTFLNLLADKTSCSQLIADYAMGLGVTLDEWRKDVVHNKKAFTKGSAVYTTHGMKVLSNPEAGFELHGGEEVPVILVDENNPLVKGTAISKDGKLAKAIKDGDVVFFYRNPMVDLTPAIIRTAKNQTVCGKYTCAVSPSVLAWSSQTDNDGDVLWVCPANQIGVANVNSNCFTTKEGIAINPSTVAGSLMKHELVGQAIANKTMDAFGCENLYSGIIKCREKFSVLNPATEIEINILEEAEKVARHYRERVGQGYSVMFNAYSTYINKINNGGVFSEAEVIGIKGCSFVYYESAGLSGYTDDNEKAFADLKERAKVHLGIHKGSSSSMINKKLRRANSGSGAGLSTEVKNAAAIFFAQHLVQSKVECAGNFFAKDAKASGIREEALANGLFRSLTKGAFIYDGTEVNSLFNSAQVNEGNPFADALKTWQSFVQNGLSVA